jgi:hypothetical protein
MGTANLAQLEPVAPFSKQPSKLPLLPSKLLRGALAVQAAS